MNGYEIIKMWNQKKGTRYPAYSNGGDSSLTRHLNNLISTYGETLVNEYIERQVENTPETDLWVVSNKPAIEKFKAQKEKENAESQKKQDMNILGLLGGEIVKLMGTELANKISIEVENKINKYIEDKVLCKVVEYKGAVKKVEGIAHEQLDTVMKFVAMNEPVMLVGPAGTGKNVIAKQVADALGLEFYFSNAVTQEYKITGYADANGNFVKTQFYEAFVNGGVFLLDEMDASCPEALIVLNCAIANGYFDFPGIGKVYAHENFRVLACANTYGTGASMEYVGRNQLDGATLNRFAIVEVGYDSRIENGVCPDKEIADFCRSFRKVCEKNGVHHIVSYREMSRLNKMVNSAKLDKTVALKTCLLKGLEEDTIRMIAKDVVKGNEYSRLLNNLINN